MTDILHLPHLRALSVKDCGDHYQIEATGDLEPTACPVCASSLYRHGSQQQTYIDTPIHGKRVMLEIDRKRYRCKSCGKTLFAPLPDIDAKRTMTERLVRLIEQRCLKETFAALSRDIGIDDKTIRHVFDDYVGRKAQEVHFQTPRILGIDELKIVGEYRCMLTNIEKQSVFDLLPTRRKADLITYFKTMPDKDKVEIVVMDMWNVYKQVAHTEFPGRPIVVDKFHVVRMANEALERVRKDIRKGLDTRTRIKLKDERFVMLKRSHNLSEEEKGKLAEWGKQFPSLLAAYKAKEQFFGIYDHVCKADAEIAAKEWERQLPEEIAWAFKDTKTALNNWWTEIFNIYEYPVTNAYTESVNRLAKDINRMGRGYSLEVVRARLLYDDKAREKTRQTLRRKVKKEIPTTGLVGYAGMGRMCFEPKSYKTIIEERTVEYGPHIPTLCDLLESGYFD